MVEIAPRIVADERVRFGKPVIKGTRVPVDVLIGKLSSGLSLEAVADEYGVEREDVLAALAYAARSLSQEQIRIVTQMPGFLVDEDLPRSLARILRGGGVRSEDVRDIGLRGRPDDEILGYATLRSLAVLTGDIGFGNTARFPLGTHPGIVVARFPNEMAISVLNDIILRAVLSLSDEEVLGNVVIVEPGRIRVRRPS